MKTDWKMLDSRMTLDHLGYIPMFLSDDNPRSAKEQIDAAYQSGWHPFKRFELGLDNTLRYPGDPPQKPLAQTKLRDELILFYPGSWVAIIQPDRSFEVARID